MKSSALASSSSITRQRPFLGAPHIVSELAWTQVVLRLILRREWAAIFGGALIIGVPFAVGNLASVATVPFVLAIFVLWFVTLARIGLVATITTVFVFYVLQTFPFTWRPAPTSRRARRRARRGDA